MTRFHLLAGLVVMVSAKAATADVAYSLRYLEPKQILARHPETRVLEKPGMKLEERWSGEGEVGKPLNYTKESTLTLFDKKQIIVMNANLKIYKVLPLDPTRDPVAGDKTSMKIKDLGEETVLGLQAQHFQSDLHLDMPNASPDADFDIHMDTWVIPRKTLKANVVAMPINPKLVSGDVAALEQMQKGYTIRTRVSRPRKDKSGLFDEVYTEELTSFSGARLDDALFAVPADYKEVSADEYAKQKRSWMMKDLDQ